MIDITLHMILHETLGHPYCSVTPPAQKGKRRVSSSWPSHPHSGTQADRASGDASLGQGGNINYLLSAAVTFVSSLSEAHALGLEKSSMDPPELT